MQVILFKTDISHKNYFFSKRVIRIWCAATFANNDKPSYSYDCFTKKSFYDILFMIFMNAISSAIKPISFTWIG
jgi:hypothetical protein